MSRLNHAWRTVGRDRNEGIGGGNRAGENAGKTTELLVLLNFGDTFALGNPQKLY